MPDGEAQKARDEVFLSQLGKETLTGPFPSRWTCPEIQPWLYGYDADEEVDAAVKERPFKPAAAIVTVKATVMPASHETKVIRDMDASRIRSKAMLSLRKLVSWLRH